MLFNPKTVVDRSTFSEPAVLPTGVEKVFVSGELVWDEGKPTAARPGKVLMGNSRSDVKVGEATRNVTGPRLAFQHIQKLGTNCVVFWHTS